MNLLEELDALENCARRAIEAKSVDAQFERHIQLANLTDPPKILRLCATLRRYRAALEFYGYEAIHNPESPNKSEQYWNDLGIWDHGSRARQALQEGEK